MINLKNVPTKPGCYLYKDSSGRIIYIGKAKNLKKRVSQYFQKKDHDAKTTALVSHIYNVDFIVTNNEVEALLLENTLIKKHKPKYNINLKDSRRFTYILITKEEYPRLVKTRERNLKGTYIGPFVSGAERLDLMRILNRTFRLRTCKRLPKRACLRHHIGLCSAPCVQKISKTDYQRDIEQATKVLKGETKQLLTYLDKNMKMHAQKLRFEDAKTCRDQINALTHLEEQQNVERTKKYQEDIINFIVKDGNVYLLIFQSEKGILHNKQEFKFSYHPDWFDEFLVQYYEKTIPKEIIVPESIDPAVKKYLNEKRGNKVIITIPKLGEKKQLLALVKKNVELSFFGEVQALESLQERLKLNETPVVIECFDISHLAGTSTVGSMVQFRYALPDKSNYRRFKIKTVDGIDDFASIAEVVKRRYSRLKAENKPLPNLIVIDGGRGQLNSAIESLKEVGIHVPIISLAKRLEEIYIPGKIRPILLSKKDKALQLLQQVRDEAHRFAIFYNRLLRKKEITR